MADLIEQLKAARQERVDKEKEREALIRKAKNLQIKTHDRRYKCKSNKYSSFMLLVEILGFEFRNYCSLYMYVFLCINACAIYLFFVAHVNLDAFMLPTCMYAMHIVFNPGSQKGAQLNEEELLDQCQCGYLASCIINASINEEELHISASAHFCYYFEGLIVLYRVGALTSRCPPTWRRIAQTALDIQGSHAHHSRTRSSMRLNHEWRSSWRNYYAQ